MISDNKTAPIFLYNSYGNNLTNASSNSNVQDEFRETDGNSSVSADDAEERKHLIEQVLELQNTLDDLSQRVDSVKEESLKLRSENQVLGQYIHNLMQASSVFQATSSAATFGQPSANNV